MDNCNVCERICWLLFYSGGGPAQVGYKVIPVQNWQWAFDTKTHKLTHYHTERGLQTTGDTGQLIPRITTPVGFCSRVLSLVTGFLTLGLVELASGQLQQMPGITGYEDTRNNADTQNNESTQIDVGTRNDAGENSGITNVLSGSVDVENGNRTKLVWSEGDR